MLCLLLVCQSGFGALSEDQKRALPPPANRPVQFGKDIQPILAASCVKCHGRGRNKGGFQIDTRETFLQGGDSGPAVVPGKSAASLLIELVSGLDPDNVMPRKGSRLTAGQVGLLRAWIDQGLPWDANITFARQTPQNLLPHSPRVRVDPASAINPIDQILSASAGPGGWRPPAPVSDRVFARRVYLDVVGLLPEPGELEAFVGDGHADKRSKLVEKLLADNQRYAEHWLSFWNDLLRNDYRGTGYIDGGRKPISKWLFTALLTNRPYDQFVAELVNPTAESEGFARGIIWRGVVNSSQTPQMQAAQNISQVFMGVNLKCASCHDSLVNDWRLADAYGLAGIYSDGPLEMFQCDKPTGQIAQCKFIYPELGEIDPHADKPARLKRLAEIITGPSDGRLSRTLVNRLWARFFGRGLVEPVDDMDQPAWNPDLLDWLAEDLVAHHYDVKHTIGRMLTSEAYQLPAVKTAENGPKEFVFQGPLVRRLSAEQFRDALGQVTGVWYDRAEFPVRTNDVRACLVASDPLLTALGRPNREQVMTSRATTATTLQALELTNGKTLAEVLDRGAVRMLEMQPDSQKLVSQVFERALCREPRRSEREIAAELAGRPARKEGVEDLLWSVAMLPEFQMIY